MDLMFRSLNFCVGSQGSLLLSDLIYLGRSVDKTATTTISKSSSSEAHSPVSIKPVESEGDLTNLLDEISYKLDFEDVSDLPRQNGGSQDNFDFNGNFDSEEAFTELYDSVSYASEDEWMSGLEFQDEDPTIFS
jgi:hypothetical protein